MGPRPLVLAALALAVLASCAPSLRRVHRASAYFEQCYAADLDQAVSDAERRTCWQAWSRDYQVGASPERLDYVHERLAMLDPDRAAAIALATGDDGSIPSLDEAPDTTTGDEVVTDAVPVPVVEPATGPVPSEVAPPDGSHEQIVADERHQRTHERHLHRGIVAPSSYTPRCPCEDGWRACSSRCLADERGCLGACRREFTLCSRSCY